MWTSIGGPKKKQNIIQKLHFFIDFVVNFNFKLIKLKVKFTSAKFYYLKTLLF